nr:ATP synthase F1 subunit gamma [Helcococcus sueciensis]
MANTKDIKRRIQGIDSIMQITNAMQLVSAAKLRKLRQRLEKTRPYFDTVYENINEVLATTTEVTPLMKIREVKNRAIIIVASDKGLAGGYNNNAVNKAIEVVNLNKEAKNIIYTTGIRSIDLIRRRGFDVNTDFTHISNDPLLEDAVAMGSYFSRKFLEGKFDEVYIIYTKFNSMISFKPETIKLLPASGFTNDKKENVKHIDYDYEPSVHTVLTQMIKQYVNVTVFSSLLESSVSEQASRSQAMENATSNGEELVDELRLEYNRARQAAITQEISEIVGGAEVLS